ncbi:NUDIX domain-containing protein [Paenibacillus eucommiae]|uniref:ADP-ribose pyrophosphatase YjhB (NUDIX family) n=1 Tax=Paenibacillus eucommiae TaxID=1355755 RepID=A0ABS4J410_9BACL|nr:NUDIX hydrolase [Paenibacillus eucommiae]MBP1994577.1 ADP-ribose pyrophosphatase YjhB (NUDIX family) [Paenibacillus eucommiae]
MKTICSAGGLIIKDDHVLLVKIAYGVNKGYLMLPGGCVDDGESFEEAAVREVKEETGIYARPKRLIGLRTGTKETPNGLELGVYVVFEMEMVSGCLVADGNEVSDVQFRPIDDVLADSQVISLTQEIILSYRSALSNSGLFTLKSTLETNNKYVDYHVYTLLKPDF